MYKPKLVQSETPKDHVEPEVKIASKQAPKQKELYWLVGGIVVVALIFIAYKFGKQSVVPPQPTPTSIIQSSPAAVTDPTVKWETFNTINFSFRYPPGNFTVRYQPTEDYFRQTGQSENTDFNDYFGYPAPKLIDVLDIFAIKGQENIFNDIRIFYFSNPEKLRSPDWYEKYQYFPVGFSKSGGFAEEKPNTPVTIGNKTGLSGFGFGMYKNKNIFIEDSDRMFLFSLEYDDPDKSTVTDQILTTFRFVDSTKVKKTYSFFLSRIGNKEYKLEWEAYDIPKGEEGFANSLFESNIKAPLSLVYYSVQSTQRILVKNLSFQLESGKPEGYFTIISRPRNSSIVYISQAIEGTDGLGYFVIDVISGEVFFPSEIQNHYRGCFDSVPFGVGDQRAYIFGCRATTTKQATLNKLDLVTKNVETIDTLENDESFECVSEWGNVFSYKYSNSEVAINICKVSDHEKIIRSKNILVN